MLGNHHDVFLPLPKRWHEDRHDVEPVKKIFPKPPLRDFLAQVFLGGTDQPNIDLNRLVAADPLKDSLLQHTQELYLYDRRDFSDFIKKERPPVGHFKPPTSLA